jgi:hypothetical protein
MHVRVNHYQANLLAAAAAAAAAGAALQAAVQTEWLGTR